MIFFNKKHSFDITKETKCLLVAPHPDDDTIGVGGVLIKYASNFDCICIGSSGIELKEPYIAPKERSKIRIEEFHNVMNLLGVKNHWIFETYGIPRFDNQIQEHFEEYCKTLKDLKKYDYIFIPHSCDGHHEHRFITNKLFKNLVKKVGYNKNTKIVFYEVWNDIQFPNLFLDLSDELLKKKIEYTKLYKSQWDYSDIYHVPAIKRQFKTNVERYRKIPIEKYLKLLSFSFTYGLVG